MSNQSPTANGKGQGPEEPYGDRGKGDKTWSPEQGEQGISNRVGDEDPTAERDSDSFGHTGKDVVSMADEVPGEEDEDDFDDEEDEDDEEEGEEGDTDESVS